MPRTLGKRPHGYLRLAHDMRAGGIGEIEEVLPAMVAAGKTLDQIRERLQSALPGVPIPSRATLWQYLQLIEEEKDYERLSAPLVRP